MYFIRTEKNQTNPGGAKYAVCMKLDGWEHYVCDMTDGNSAEDVSANELGLTLRARLVRSKGKYAMLEGTIFNPERLLDAACEITDFSTEEFTGGEYKNGYTLLTVTADGCVNKYMVFNKLMLETLTKKLKTRSIKSAD